MSEQFTTLELMYRDTSNYKQFTRINFRGAITPEQEAQFRAHLLPGEHLRPAEVGLSGASFEDSHYEDDDFSVNEFSSFEVFDYEFGDYTDERTITEFINEFITHEWSK